MSPERLHKAFGAALAILAAAYIITLMIVLPQADVMSPVFFGLVMFGIGAFSFSSGFLGARILMRVGTRRMRQGAAARLSSGSRGEPEA